MQWPVHFYVWAAMFGAEVLAVCILETPAQNQVLINSQLACGVEVKINIVKLTPCYYSGEPCMGSRQIRWKYAMARKQAWCMGQNFHYCCAPFRLGAGPNLIL